MLCLRLAVSNNRILTLYQFDRSPIQCCTIVELSTNGHCAPSLYRIAGNFREAEIFAIFVIKRQLTKICSRENFFLQKFFADKLRTPSTVCLSHRSSKSIENLS